MLLLKAKDEGKEALCPQRVCGSRGGNTYRATFVEHRTVFGPFATQVFLTAEFSFVRSRLFD